MQSFTAKEAKNRFGEVLAVASKTPVTITKNGKDAVVIVPAGDFRENKKEKMRELYETWEKLGQQVESSGATQEEIDADIYSND